jgi:hypothetical protein
MPALVAGILAAPSRASGKHSCNVSAWMAGTSPAMTGLGASTNDGPSRFETPAAQAPQDEGPLVAHL